MTDYRTNPLISITPLLQDDDPQFVVRDVHRNRSYELPNYTVVHLLGEAVDGLTREDLQRIAVEEYGLTADLAESVVTMFEEKRLLVPTDAPEIDLQRRREQWREDDWATAFDFYDCIRDYPYYEDNDPESILDRVSDRVERNEPVPDVYKNYEDAPRTDLPDVDESEPLGSVRSVLTEREPQESDETSVGVDCLSTLLFYAFGEIDSQTLEDVGEFPLKTSPSGGGRHPTEAYVVVFDVEGIDRGVYHYAVEDHSLERLAPASAGAEMLGESDPESAFAVVLTSVVARQMWKYRDPRAFRIPHHDAGHLVETMRLLCRTMDLPSTVGHELDRASVAECLRIDRLEEPILGYALVG